MNLFNLSVKYNEWHNAAIPVFCHDGVKKTQEVICHIEKILNFVL